MRIDMTTEDAGGVGFVGLLTMLFIALKLTGYITWTWWWVLSPILAPIVLVLVVVVIWCIARIAVFVLDDILN